MYCIYKATNLKNNKIYIGQTVSTIKHRMNGHFREARSEKRKNTYFHNAIEKYGEENFIFEELDSAITIEELNIKEKYWIENYNSTNKNIGYNLDMGGTNGFKSESTKEILRGTTKKLWEDEDRAERMRTGLAKATKKWQEVCESKLVEHTCEECGKKEKIQKHLSNKRFCSYTCAKENNNRNQTYKKGLEKANQTNKTKAEKKSKEIKELVLNWTKLNQEIVLSCPFNKITPVLSDLSKTIHEKHNVKDIRSISYSCCGTNGKREFLVWLKNIAKMYSELV